MLRRVLLVRSSGCGKTNLLLNLLYKNGSGLKFKYCYMFSKSIEQPAYSDLGKQLEKVESKTEQEIANLYAIYEELIPVDE